MGGRLAGGEAIVNRLLDTDIFSLYLASDPVIVPLIARRSATLHLSVISAQEMWDGWHTAIRKAKTPVDLAFGYAQLTALLMEVGKWPILAFPEPAMDTFADLKRLRLNVGLNDLKIAAIALDVGATVVTRNTRDFSRVPGLTVETW